MHYYKRNIGDYAKKAGKLSMLEHGAYTLLMDSCYDRETFPTLEEAIDWCWARTEAEIEAVKFVLRKFFTLDGDRYVQNRMREEIEAFHEKSKTNSRIATEREAKRTKRARSVNESSPEKHEAPPNQEPLTINQKPITPQPPKGGCRRFEEFWTAWPKSERKQDKVKCADKWRKMGLDAEADRILADVATKKQTEKWRGGFIEAPLVYLNGRRWEDGVTPAEPGSVQAVIDPESRAAVEAEGVKLGMGKWNEESGEHWLVYKARVREAQGMTA